MGENKKYYWLKLPTDFFNSIEMKRLKKVAGGNTYTVIYLKMMLMSLEDGGIIYHEGVCPTVHEELALELNEEIDDIKMTISFLENVGLLGRVDVNSFEMIQVGEMTGSETDVAKRVRKHRRREALKQANEGQKVLQSNGDLLHCNTDVTKCNTEKEIEIEKEKELDKDLDILSGKPDDVSIIITYLNDKTGSHYKKSTRKTKDLINARKNEGFTVSDFQTVIDKKTKEWKGTDMEKYLRPVTLFGTKFESYLNQPVKRAPVESTGNPFLDMLIEEGADIEPPRND